jgi:hypothetical protein
LPGCGAWRRTAAPNSKACNAERRLTYLGRRLMMGNKDRKKDKKKPKKTATKKPSAK